VFILAYASGKRRQQIARSAHGTEATDERRTEKQGNEPASHVEDVAYAENPNRRREQQQREQEPHRRPGPSREREDVAYASATRLQERQQRQLSGTQRNDEGGAASEFCAPPFPPGPDGLDAWREVLAVRPDLEPSISSEEAKCSFRRVADELADRLDGGLGHAKAIRSCEALRRLWYAAYSEADKRKARRLWCIQSQKVLQQVLYGSRADEGQPVKRCLQEASEAFEKECLRALRVIGEAATAPQGQGLEEQRSEEPGYSLCVMPHDAASCRGRYCAKEGKAALQNLWEAVLPNNGAIMQYAQNAEASWQVGRVDRLRLTGNGVVPLVAATAFAVLADRAGLRE
jgi:hypothetical protein